METDKKVSKQQPNYVASTDAKYVVGSKNINKVHHSVHHSILIGDGLTTTKSYHLLVDRKGIKIDKIMTPEEYDLLHQVLNSISDLKLI
jgi:hypothetical protein